MRKFKARKEREQLEAIVRPRISIQDPSQELFLQIRPWEHDDPLQDSFLEQPEKPQSTKDYHRVLKLKFRNTVNQSPANETLYSVQEQKTESQNECTIAFQPVSAASPSEGFTEQFDVSFINFDDDDDSDDSEGTEISSPMESPASEVPSIPQRHPNHVPSTVQIPARLSSLRSKQKLHPISTSLSKTDFQAFSQKCAPSPVSISPETATAIFELSGDEMSPAKNFTSAESPVELEGTPVEVTLVHQSPLHIGFQPVIEPEPEASPYNRFTAFTKSIHALNANLSPIEETEEEACSKRSSAVQVYELPAVTHLHSISPSSYSDTSSLIPRSRYAVKTAAEMLLAPPQEDDSRHSSDSGQSLLSDHSTFSFEYTNADTEKIFVSSSIPRRNSSAPSLTDVSSVDDFDIDLDIDTDSKRQRSLSNRDAKLERFFGIQQYSINSKSDTSLAAETVPSTSGPEDNDLSSSSKLSYKSPRSAISIDDLDLSLALENNPYRREIMLMHRSILAKSMNKQDAKLEKFFGCNQNIIKVARNRSTGSRLAGTNEDLKYRSIGW